MKSIINADAMIDQLKDQLNAAMVDAAEPLIIESLANIEKQLRKELAARLVSLIEANYSMKDRTTTLQINVMQRPEDDEQRYK